VTDPTSPFNFIILLNIVALVIGLASIVYIKRPSYRFYSLAYLLIITAMPLVRGNMPHSTGLFRFILGVFPVYIFLGCALKSRVARYLATGISICILCAISYLIANKVYLA